MKFNSALVVLALLGLAQVAVTQFNSAEFQHAMEEFFQVESGSTSSIADSRWVIVGEPKVDNYLNVFVNVQRVELHLLENETTIARPNLLGAEGTCLMASMQAKEVFYLNNGPLKDLVASFVTCSKVQRKTKELLEKKGDAFRPCPHSYGVRIAGVGDFGSRGLSVGDIAEMIPADWQFETIIDVQSNTMHVVTNRAGKGFAYPPGAQYNIGVTAWVYDSSSNKILKMVQKRGGSDVVTFPGGNLDMAQDRRDFSTHPFHEEIADNKRAEMGGKYFDMVHGAVREFIEETGLYRPVVQEKLLPEAKEALLKIIRQEDVRLVQFVEWQANNMSPSVNFHFAFVVAGISKLLPAETFVGDANEGIKSINWIDATREEKFSIDHGMAVRTSTIGGKMKGHALITAPVDRS